MLKRVLATALWFYATWYAWAILASVTGLPELLGAFVGLALGAFVGLDPMHRFWKPKSPAPAAPLVSLEAETV